MWGDHDRNFWDLCGQIEREVREGDWRSGGKAVSDEVFYDPRDREGSAGHVDGGGWSGGEFVLGGSGEAGTAASAAGTPTQGLSRREAMARAAEERMKRQREAGGGGGQSAS